MRLFKVIQERFFGPSEELVSVQIGTKTVQVPRADKSLPEGLRIGGFVTISEYSLSVYEALGSTLSYPAVDNKIEAVSSIEIDEDCKVYRAYLDPIQDPMSDFILCTEFKSKPNYAEKLLFTPVHIEHPQTEEEVWKEIQGPDGVGSHTFTDNQNNTFTRCTKSEFDCYEKPYETIEEGITNAAGSEGWKALLTSCMYSRELSVTTPEYLLIEIVEFKVSSKKLLPAFVRYAVGIPLPTDVKFVKPLQN